MFKQLPCTFIFKRIEYRLEYQFDEFVHLGFSAVSRCLLGQWLDKTRREHTGFTRRFIHTFIPALRFPLLHEHRVADLEVKFGIRLCRVRRHALIPVGREKTGNEWTRTKPESPEE